MNESVQLRALRADDRAPLEGVLRSDGTFREEEIVVALELIDDAIEGSDDYFVLVATVSFCMTEGAPVIEQVGGYICYGPTPMTDATYDLYWVATHERARGRGVAGGLIRGMEADLRSRGGLGIRVETSQVEGYGAARKLYQHYEYPEVGRLANFYRAGDDLIVYYKRL